MLFNDFQVARGLRNITNIFYPSFQVEKTYSVKTFTAFVKQPIRTKLVVLCKFIKSNATQLLRQMHLNLMLQFFQLLFHTVISVDVHSSCCFCLFVCSSFLLPFFLSLWSYPILVATFSFFISLLEAIKSLPFA